MHNNQNENKTVVKAAKALLNGYDQDHAQKLNNVGYNKFDGAFVREILSKYDTNGELTIKQENALYKTLQKYHDQFNNFFNIDIKNIRKEATKTSEEIKKEKQKTQSYIIKKGDNNNEIIISFPYDKDLVSSIKDQIYYKNRKFDPSSKTWKVNVNTYSVENVKKFINKHKNTFEISENVNHIINTVEEIKKNQEKEKEISRDDNEKLSSADESQFELPSGFKLTPYPYQKAGIEYIVKNKRVIVGDDMGLGKTIETIGAIHYLSAFPCLIICPAGLKYNWEKEFHTCLDNLKIQIIEGKNQELNKNKDVYIINYDIVKHYSKSFSDINLKMVVADECHYIKNYKAQRSKHTQELLSLAPYKIGLTGTAVDNRPQELISQIIGINRMNDFGGFWNFAKKYCNATKKKYGWDFSGASNLDELHNELRRICYLRRDKKQVLNELPSKTRNYIPVSLENQKEYQKAEENLVEYIQEKIEKSEEIKKIRKDIEKAKAEERFEDVKLLEDKLNESFKSVSKAAKNEALVKINKLKYITAKSKIKPAKEYINNYIENDKKVVVFTHHNFVIDELVNEFNALRIDGSVSSKKRDENVEKFQNDPNQKIIICNIKAAGVGLTLTASHNILFVEQLWTPGEHDQCEDRCLRIGQKYPVNINYLLTQNTIDYDTYKLIENKREVTDKINKGKSDENVETNIVNEVINEIVKKYE